MFILYLISTVLSFNIEIGNDLQLKGFQSIHAGSALTKVVKFVALDGDVEEVSIETGQGEKLDLPFYYHQVTLGGYPILYLCLFPVRDTTFIKDVKVNVVTRRRDYRLNSLLTRIVRDLVINPEDVLEPYKTCDSASYIVITKNEYLSRFDPLVLWKTEKGTPAKSVSLEWIYQNFPSKDSANSIKDYIRYAFENLGTYWVLLGGDAGIIPVKRQYVTIDTPATTGEALNYIDSIPSDLFYSELYSPWDSCDMLPEVFVGRAPVNNAEDVDIFVQKVLGYEKNPDSNYIESAFLLGFPVDTDDNYITVKNYIDTHHLPSSFYVNYGSGGISSTLGELNHGYHLVNHGGLGDYDRLEVGGEWITSTLIDGLENGNRVSLIYALGSYCGGFHLDCIGEHLMLNPDGGAFGFIGNSSTGWYSDGDIFKYSGEFDTLFYKILMFGEERRLGNVFTNSKIPFISYDNDPYRWCEFSLNLLGDPELPIFLENPLTPQVSHPSFIPVAECTVRIYVKRNNINYYGAAVCLFKEGDFYLVGNSNTYGYARFIINPQGQGICKVCITGPGIRPYQGKIEIGDSLFPDFEVSRYYTQGDESNDLRLDPGEVADLVVTIKNSGYRDADGVSASLSTNDIYITIIENDADLGYIQIGETSDGLFRVMADEETPIGYEVSLRLTIQTSTGYIQRVPFTLKIGSIPLEYATHSEGNFYFTISNDGSYGFTSLCGGEGVGFIYPKDGSNLLYYGTLLFGNSPTYVCDNSLDSDFICERGLFFGDRIFSSEDGWCRFTDGGAPFPRELALTQDSWVFSDSLYDDFIIIRLNFSTEQPLDSAYIGVWFDFDMQDEYARVEEGIGYIFKNQKSNIKYQKLNTESRKDERFKSQKSKVKSQKVEESKGQIYAAVAGLSGRINNISVIPNDIFIYPDGGLSDYYAYRFLSGELSFDEGEVPGDYSLLISFGPYCLFEGEGGEVVFAVIGGFSRDEILERFTRAQDKLGEMGVEEENDIRNPYLEILEVYPNPFIKRLSISLKSSLEDEIRIYDIVGRLVSILQVDNTDGKITGTVWDAEGVTSGIYFISTPQTVRKVVKLR